MCYAAINAMAGSPIINRQVREFMDAAMELKRVIPEGVNLHCFITFPMDSITLVEAQSSLIPLVSKLFHSALHASGCGSTAVGQELRNISLLAHRASNGRFCDSSHAQSPFARPQVSRIGVRYLTRYMSA